MVAVRGEASIVKMSMNVRIRFCRFVKTVYGVDDFGASMLLSLLDSGAGSDEACPLFTASISTSGTFLIDAGEVLLDLASIVSYNSCNEPIS